MSNPKSVLLNSRVRLATCELPEWSGENGFTPIPQFTAVIGSVRCSHIPTAAPFTVAAAVSVNEFDTAKPLLIVQASIVPFTGKLSKSPPARAAAAAQTRNTAV